MKTSAQFVAAVVLILAAHQSSATLYLHGSFGRPVVVGDKLIFGDNFFDARRLICIDRKNGTKQWEITDQSHLLNPWLEADGHLIVTSGSVLKRCDVASGKLTALYNTGFKGCSRVTRHGPRVFVFGHRSNVDCLLALDPETWGKRWETPRIDHVSAYGHDVLLCVETTKQPTKDGAFQILESRLAAISTSSGKVIWRRSLTGFDFIPNAIATPKEFIVAIGNKALCLAQVDGRVLKEIELTESPFVSVNFVSRDGKPLMWSHFTLCELSVPDLKARDLLYAGGYYAHSIELHGDIVLPGTLGEHSAWHIPTGKKIWEYRGQWHESSVHEGYLYFGKPEKAGTTMNKIEIVTGKIEKLYQEELKEDRD